MKFHFAEFLHSKHYIHRDVKPDNFLMGVKEKAAEVFAIDFGLSKKYMDSKHQHIPYKENKVFIPSFHHTPLLNSISFFSFLSTPRIIICISTSVQKEFNRNSTLCKSQHTSRDRAKPSRRYRIHWIHYDLFPSRVSSMARIACRYKIEEIRASIFNTFDIHFLCFIDFREEARNRD